MKQAYELTECGDWATGMWWSPVTTTGRCKKVTGGLDGEKHYVQVQRKLFGIPLWKSWVSANNIKWVDPVIETEYTCNCENC